MCTCENSPETPAATSSIPAPQTSGIAARPIASAGRRKRGEMQTPTAQAAAPIRTAPIPQVRLLRCVNSRKVKSPTPTRPSRSPTPFIQLIFSCFMAAPIARIQRASLATNNAANPDDTCCSAQCRLPCPTKKKSAPTTAPATQCSRRGRNPRLQQ